MREAKRIPQHVRRLRLPVPSRDSTFLLKLLKLDLQNHAPRAAVIAVKVVATPARARTRQMGLFLPLSPEPEQLEVTLARIRNTVGDDRVGSPKLLDTHRPNAFRQDRFVVPEAFGQGNIGRGAYDGRPAHLPPAASCIGRTRWRKTVQHLL